jgi:hypothetical protein
MTNFILRKFLCCISIPFIILAGSATAQTSNEQAASSARPNPVTIAATQQGVLACSARINQVVNFLGFNENSGALLILPPSQQDQRVVGLAMELPYPSVDNPAYVSATFASNPASGCGASYDAVVYWPKNCDDVVKQDFATFKTSGRLKKNVVVLDGGSQLRAFLLPAGKSGCVSIKREVLF